jgi:peptide chain release factor 3
MLISSTCLIPRLSKSSSASAVLDAAPMAPSGHRGADPQALRGLPLARRADHHLVNKLCAPCSSGGAPIFVTTAYLGSALNNFGVRELLAGLASSLRRRASNQPKGPIGRGRSHPRSWRVHRCFVFKVQANIDPQHRDRIAFVRIASGRFERGMKLKNIRTGRVMSVQAPCFS